MYLFLHCSKQNFMMFDRIMVYLGISLIIFPYRHFLNEEDLANHLICHFGTKIYTVISLHKICFW